MLVVLENERDLSAWSLGKVATSVELELLPLTLVAELPTIGWIQGGVTMCCCEDV